MTTLTIKSQSPLIAGGVGADIRITDHPPVPYPDQSGWMLHPDGAEIALTDSGSVKWVTIRGVYQASGRSEPRDQRDRGNFTLRRAGACRLEDAPVEVQELVELLRAEAAS